MDPVGQFVGVIAGLLSVVEAIFRPAFYLAGTILCFKVIRELK